MNPSTELRDLTLQIAHAISDGDVAVLERHTSRHPGTGFLGTDPDEWWTDLAGLRQALVGQHEAGVTFIPSDPVAYQQGEVGWAIDHRMRFRVGEQEGPFRMTVVYRREDGVWKMVHFHSSIGVPNEDAIGVELPAKPARGADTAEPTSAQRRTQPFHGHVAMIRQGPRKR